MTQRTVAHQVPLSMGFSRQNPRVDCHALLQGIFLTQGSNMHCRQILYRLSYQSILSFARALGGPILCPACARCLGSTSEASDSVPAVKKLSPWLESVDPQSSQWLTPSEWSTFRHHSKNLTFSTSVPLSSAVFLIFLFHRKKLWLSWLSDLPSALQL